jgi:hypothetical protein
VCCFLFFFFIFVAWFASFPATISHFAHDSPSQILPGLHIHKHLAAMTRAFISLSIASTKDIIFQNPLLSARYSPKVDPLRHIRPLGKSFSAHRTTDRTTATHSFPESQKTVSHDLHEKEIRIMCAVSWCQGRRADPRRLHGCPLPASLHA